MERFGDWMQTADGCQFWPMDPRPEEIFIEVIATALSNLCRFGGHVRRFYSVAEHSVILSRAVPPELARWALLHDASEAYLVDVPRPIKPFLVGYKGIEEKLMYCIATRFGLEWPEPSALKEYDLRILLNERATILAPSGLRWDIEDMGPLPGVEIPRIGPSPYVAQIVFWERFCELFPEEA